jgi:hypothetical protein
VQPAGVDPATYLDDALDWIQARALRRLAVLRRTADVTSTMTHTSSLPQR